MPPVLWAGALSAATAGKASRTESKAVPRLTLTGSSSSNREGYAARWTTSVRLRQLDADTFSGGRHGLSRRPSPTSISDKQAKLLAIDGLNILRRVYEASPEPG